MSTQEFRYQIVARIESKGRIGEWLTQKILYRSKVRALKDCKRTKKNLGNAELITLCKRGNCYYTCDKEKV